MGWKVLIDAFSPLYTRGPFHEQIMIKVIIQLNKIQVTFTYY